MMKPFPVATKNNRYTTIPAGCAGTVVRVHTRPNAYPVFFVAIPGHDRLSVGQANTWPMFRHELDFDGKGE